MPRYFFHLTVGDRLLPDEEGVELASRAAARQEALAVVRELSGSMASQWAGWFLRVADRRGQFLSLPLGHPALELVSNDRPWISAETPRTAEEGGDRSQAASLTARAAAVFAETSVARRRMAALRERHHQLRDELSAELRANQAASDRARQLTEYARLETSEPNMYRIAARRHSPPHLVLMHGRE